MSFVLKLFIVLFGTILAKTVGQGKIWGKEYKEEKCNFFSFSWQVVLGKVEEEKEIIEKCIFPLNGGNHSSKIKNGFPWGYPRRSFLFLKSNFG